MRERKAYKEGGCAKPDKNINEIVEKFHKKNFNFNFGHSGGTEIKKNH
jgi:hypothetical protein